LQKVNFVFGGEVGWRWAMRSWQKSKLQTLKWAFPGGPGYALILHRH